MLFGVGFLCVLRLVRIGAFTIFDLIVYMCFNLISGLLFEPLFVDLRLDVWVLVLGYFPV